jgi:uracil-DNA glycosylase family 4
MLKKPAGCEGCPLKDKGQGFVPDKCVPNPQYMVIGEAPGKNEVVKGEPFIGKSGFVLDNWLIRAVPTLRIAKEKNQISYANTLRCLPPEVQGRAYPKGEERALAEAHCRQYDDIPHSIHTIVLFGDAPQRCYFGEELTAEDAGSKRLGHDLKGVMGRVGREYEKSGKRWVFAPHPAYILRQPALVQHGQMALQIAANTEKAIEPDYVQWDAALEELNGQTTNEVTASVL